MLIEHVIASTYDVRMADLCQVDPHYLNMNY